MSDLSNVAQKEFDALVHLIYENGSAGKKLRSTVRNRTNFIGNSIDWRKVASVIMEEGAFQTQVPLTDATYSPVTGTLTKYILAIPVDDIERFTVNFDERREDAMLVAGALARREDQLVITSLDDSSPPGANVIANSGTNLNFLKLRQVVERFDDIGVPPEMRHMLISAAGQQALFFESQMTSSDFINLDLVKTGSLDGNFAMGMNFHVIPTMAEGGLPKAANIRTCFAYHTMSTGYAARDFSTQIDEIPRDDIWQIKLKTYATCDAIDATGIVKVDIDESVTPS